MADSGQRAAEGTLVNHAMLTEMSPLKFHCPPAEWRESLSPMQAASHYFHIVFLRNASLQKLSCGYRTELSGHGMRGAYIQVTAIRGRSKSLRHPDKCVPYCTFVFPKNTRESGVAGAQAASSLKRHKPEMKITGVSTTFQDFYGSPLVPFPSVTVINPLSIRNRWRKLVCFRTEYSMILFDC